MEIKEVIKGSDYDENRQVIAKLVENKDVEALKRIKSSLTEWSNVNLIGAVGLGVAAFIAANFKQSGILDSIAQPLTVGTAATLSGVLLASSLENRNLAKGITYSLK